MDGEKEYKIPFVCSVIYALFGNYVECYRLIKRLMYNITVKFLASRFDFDGNKVNFVWWVFLIILP